MHFKGQRRIKEPLGQKESLALYSELNHANRFTKKEVEFPPLDGTSELDDVERRCHGQQTLEVESSTSSDFISSQPGHVTVVGIMYVSTDFQLLVSHIGPASLCH